MLLLQVYQRYKQKAKSCLTGSCSQLHLWIRLWGNMSFACISKIYAKSQTLFDWFMFPATYVNKALRKCVFCKYIKDLSQKPKLFDWFMLPATYVNKALSKCVFGKFIKDISQKTLSVTLVHTPRYMKCFFGMYIKDLS